MDNDRFNFLVGKIYDCAVDPDQWEHTLTLIRDDMNLAFVSMNFVDFSPTYPETPPDMMTFITPWDQDWIDSLAALVPTIPHFDEMRSAEMDIPVSQLSLIAEEDFHKTDFYRQWVEPQQLRDACNINVIKRERQTAIMSATTFKDRDLFSDADFNLMNKLSGHLRRAMLISDMVDEQKSWIRIYNRLLDKISVAVCLVGADAKIMYNNAAAEELLSAGKSVTAKVGKLVVQSPGHQYAFESAVLRACTMHDADIGSWGNGMALPGADGEVSVAYILPLGRSERRRALGPGLAAIFLTNAASARPPSLEILSALSGLTPSEAKVALAIAEGQSTEIIAQKSSVSIHTLRKHLANIYDKTGIRSQSALATFVNRLNVPVK